MVEKVLVPGTALQIRRRLLDAAEEMGFRPLEHFYRRLGDRLERQRVDGEVIYIMYDVFWEVTLEFPISPTLNPQEYLPTFPKLVDALVEDKSVRQHARTVFPAMLRNEGYIEDYILELCSLAGIDPTSV